MTDRVNIYRAGPDDKLGLDRLAELDSQPPPTEPMLIAAVDGQLQAAVPLHGGRAIADPFQRTAQLVALLELRAAQLNSRSSRRRLPYWLRRSATIETGRQAWIRPPKRRYGRPTLSGER
ncbi:MAG TPA: hypothetical protein VLP43_02370 [Solirubrobacteraceae bacterium]|nr:hypothetical protein [Solirubrobacteraceae bacterium]